MINQTRDEIKQLLIDFYLSYGNPQIMTDISKRAKIREQYSAKIMNLFKRTGS